MPTSHRGEKQRRSLSPRALIIAVLVVVALAAIAYLVLGLLTGSSDDSSGHASGTASRAGRAGPAPSASRSAASPSTSPTPSKTAKPRDLTHVEATPPHQISIGGSISEEPFGPAIGPTSGRLIPDGLDALQRLADRGIPGSPGTDTVVVVGAASSSGDGVLDGIDDVRDGATIVLESQNALLTYRVTETRDVDAMKVLSLDAVTGKHPDRLVIDAAHYSGSERVGPDRVVVAELVKAEPLRP